MLHIGVEQPVDDEERSFDPSDFAEGDGQFVLARIGRELSQQLARGEDTIGQGGSNPPPRYPFIPAGAALSVKGRPAYGPARRPNPRPTGTGSVSYEWYGDNCASGTLSVHFPMTASLIGYARCSTDRQDLDAQRQALLELGVAEDRIYTDHGLTGTTRARPGLDQALAAVRQGDTLVVPKLDRRGMTGPRESAGALVILGRLRRGMTGRFLARAQSAD